MHFVNESALNMGALQALPGDVLLIILYELATQDILAFMRATFACKELKSAAESSPDLWKSAFLFPSISNEGFDTIRSEGFDAQVEALGGYKQLLTARAASLAHRKTLLLERAFAHQESEQTHHQSVDQGLSPPSPVPISTLLSEGFTADSSILVVVRFDEAPVAYRDFSLWELVPPVYSKVSYLRPLLPPDKIRECLLGRFQIAASATATGFRQLLLDSGLVSLEVFACKHPRASTAASGGGKNCPDEEKLTYGFYTMTKESSMCRTFSESKPTELASLAVALSGTILGPKLRESGRDQNVDCSPAGLDVYFDMQDSVWKLAWKPPEDAQQYRFTKPEGEPGGQMSL